jgi:replicative DNA helicase
VIIEDFKQCIATQFPTCAIKQYGIDYSVAQPKNAAKHNARGHFEKSSVTLWLEDLQLKGKRAEDKFFPACIWKWSKRYLAGFLRILMSCDGCIYSLQGKPWIEFTVASQQLASDVHHAFVRFGIVAKLSQKTAKAWRVEITNPESVKRYQDEIGWFGEKSTRFSDYVHVISKRGGNNGHAPKETWELVRTGVQRQGLSLIELARRAGETTATGHDAGYNAHIKRSIPRYRLQTYADVLDNNYLRRVANPDIYWDEIVSIEPIGEHQVYDLTVPDGANFIAQDVIVHNTSMALSLAHNTAVKYQRSVAIFSLEMSKEQLAQRLLSMDAGIDQQRLRTGWIEDNEWDRIVIARDTLEEASIWIDDTASISTTELRSKARRLQAQEGVDLIIIDYLQLMQATIGGRRNENRVQEISEISRSLKALARELNVPVLALAQLSRAVESRQSKVPQLSDLRESGCLTGDTLVYLPDSGSYKPIEQLAGQSGFQVLALHTRTWKLESCAVTNAFATGRKPVYKMTTRLGRSIRATANHQFLTIQGWQRLDTLSDGMRIALPRHVNDSNEYCQPTTIRPQFCRDRGWMRGRAGALCLSSLPSDSLGHRDTNGSYLHEDRHQAPTSTLPFPLSLQDAGLAATSGDVYWDEITSIEPDGEAEVYDMTVEGLHNFVAGDIVVHNSIEQDADIVMFIYRDDVYNQDTEKKNIADIIVAKHRNGPLDEVSLYFQASQTRFRDLEVNQAIEE